MGNDVRWGTVSVCLQLHLNFVICLICVAATKFGAWEFNYVKTQDFFVAACEVFDPDARCVKEETEDEIEFRRELLADYVLHWSRLNVTPVLFSDFAKQYSLSIYWSSLTLTTSGQQPFPTATAHNLLEIMDTISGVLVFAVIVGSVGNVVVTMNKARAEYQNLMDGIKFYMNYR